MKHRFISMQMKKQGVLCGIQLFFYWFFVFC